MGRTLLCILACALLVASIVDERSKQLDKEYEQLLGEDVENSVETDRASEDSVAGNEDEQEKTAEKKKFNPHEDLHNEEFKKWANGEPYILAKSKASAEGYVCQQFTLPTDEGTSLKLLNVKDLNECKEACNEERGKNIQKGHVGCNAFAYLAGANKKGEEGITTNECHLKRHFMYQPDWQKVANPWIFCVQRGPGTGDTLEAFVATSESVLSFSKTTLSLMGCSALLSGLAVYFILGRRGKMHYLLMVDDAEI